MAEDGLNGLLLGEEGEDAHVGAAHRGTGERRSQSCDDTACLPTLFRRGGVSCAPVGTTPAPALAFRRVLRRGFGCCFRVTHLLRDIPLLDTPDILLLTEPIQNAQLRTLVERFFVDMVKFVADVERRMVAIGGELHADAEALLLDHGSRQENLWGANYYPGRGRDGCIEYTALINIRPSGGNRSMEIEDAAIRARIRDLAYRLIGEGEALP